MLPVVYSVFVIISQAAQHDNIHFIAWVMWDCNYIPFSVRAVFDLYEPTVSLHVYKKMTVFALK